MIKARHIVNTALLSLMLFYLDGSAQAQVIGIISDPAPPTGIEVPIPNPNPVNTIYLNEVDISPADADLANLFVTPGSSLVLNIHLGTSNQNVPVHSLAVSFSDEPYLTLSSLSPEFPAGWAGSSTTSSVSGIDVTGDDIGASDSNLAQLTYTVSSDAPIGSVLALPSVTDFSFLDAQGNSITTTAEFIIPGYGATVIAAPEPPCAALILLGLGWLLIGQIRRTTFC